MMFIKRAALPFMAITLIGAGCGSDKAARQDESASSLAHKRRAPKRTDNQDPVPGMSVDSELGVLDTEDVEATLKDHFDDIRGCYQRAGKAQRYAGGRVLLRFLVGGEGISQDVLVVESTLGNYDVERCLVEVGRRIAFHAPSGHKPTTFEYPVEFRSTNQLAVLEVDGVKLDHDLSVFLPQLAVCGQLAVEDANAIIYIEPNGFPGSVGLAAGSTLDEDVGDCMVQTIRRWRMSSTLPGRVMRASFSIPPVIATAEATPPRRTASGHRRRH
jgi:TonB family protein